MNIEYAAFRDNPEKHPPTMTKSGKTEVYCQAKEDCFDMVNGYGNGGAGVLDFVRATALPRYLDHPFGYEDAKSGRYPIQAAHNHYPRRAYTDCDNLPWLREAFRNPVFVSDEDAMERGVKNGGVVKVYNDLGAFLRPATVTPTVIKGCLAIPHGATAQIDEETGLEGAVPDAPPRSMRAPASDNEMEPGS